MLESLQFQRSRKNADVERKTWGKKDWQKKNVNKGSLKLKRTVNKYIHI